MSIEKEKTCSKCGEIKLLSEFSADKRVKSGLRASCRSCDSKYQKDNREALRIKKVRYKKNNPEYMAKARERNIEWNKNNLEYKKQWDKKNRDKGTKKYAARLRAAKRYAAKLQRTVAWSDDWKIQQFYIVARKLTKMYGVQFHVDHIVPLQGKLVSGLHVENNLQIITADENIRKRNNFIPG